MCRSTLLFVAFALTQALAWDVCPSNWNRANCLGSSGSVGFAEPTPYLKSPISWKSGMSGHSHYSLKNAALFVIDPQMVYSACPDDLTVESLLNPPSASDFKGQSPLCCEKFFSAVANQNKIAAVMRKVGLPVFVHLHVYRDLDGDGAVDNCNRMCDFDVLGWQGWPEAWNLWNEALPWHAPVFSPDGFAADTQRDFLAEKSVFSAMTIPVLAKLKQLKVDTIIITGFMTQYCSVTTARHAHDLGFKVVFVKDANDGPKLLQLLSTVDENEIIPFYLGVPVADVANTDEVIEILRDDFGIHDEL